MRENCIILSCCRVAMVVAGVLLSGCARRPGYVAMLTDYGTRDHYSGVLAASVLCANPDARLVVITHDIDPFNIVQGAFVLSETVYEFPAGTIVLAVVDPGVGTSRAPIVAVTKAGHVLVGPDNGLFDLVLRREGVQAVYLIENTELLHKGVSGSDFYGRDLFGPIAGALSRGVPPQRVGPRLESWIRLDLPEAVREPEGFRGAVLHIDRFGNLLTNIPGAWLKAWPTGSEFKLTCPGTAAPVTPCTRQNTYADVPEGAFLLLENESWHVEIAQNRKMASKSLGVKVGDPVNIRKTPEH